MTSLILSATNTWLLYSDANPEDPKDDRSIIYYVTDINQQGQYIKMFKEQGMNAVILTFFVV